MMGDDYAERKMRDFLTTSMVVDDNDAAYQVDYVRALLREQVPTGYVKGEVHFFNSSSMWAM